MGTDSKAVYYDCGICDHIHPWTWNGDCRDDDNRYTLDALAAKLGMPEEDIDVRSMEERVQADEEGR